MSALPHRVDPRRLASTRGVVEGDQPLSGMPRLAEYLLPESTSEAGTAWLRLEFAEDDQRRITITGRVRAPLTLCCQRCLGPVDWPVDAAVRVMAVSGDEAAAEVPRDWEPVVVGAEGLEPAALAEDELILALPLVAHCDNEECRRRFERSADAERADNPFAALADLKRDR